MSLPSHYTILCPKCKSEVEFAPYPDVLRCSGCREELILVLKKDWVGATRLTPERRRVAPTAPVIRASGIEG